MAISPEDQMRKLARKLREAEKKRDFYRKSLIAISVIAGVLLFLTIFFAVR